MRSRCLALAVVAMAAACTRVEVRSSTDSAKVLASLQGAWYGSWISHDATVGSGQVAVEIRVFQGRPLVRVQIDNPCLEPRAYTFFQAGARIELRADGAPVFWADLRGEHTMTGGYACPADAGSWSASWQQELPPVGNLTGTWHGTIASVSPPVAGEFELDLVQRWQDGFLIVEGALAAPALGIAPVPGQGMVEWRTETFALQFTTDPGSGAQVHLEGVGVADALRVDDGIAIVAPDPRVPFRLALWQAVLVR